MDLINLAYDTLKETSLPVSHLTRPENIPGLSYYFLGSKPTLYGDGIARREERECQVDLWAKNANFGDYPEKIIALMRRAGFRYVREDFDIERSAGVYRKSLIFLIDYNVEV